MMNPTLRLSLALIAGILAAFITIALGEAVGHALFPATAWLAAAGLIGIPIAAFLTAGLCRRLFRPGVATHD